MQKTVSTTVAVLLFIAGLGLGYMCGTAREPRVQVVQAPAPLAMHMMPDGSMMDSNGKTMSMDDMMTSMNAALTGKSGDQFDQAFLREMIVHHQGAVEMAKLALTSAKHQEIIDLAKAIITAQEKEIGDMKSWQATWYTK